MGPGRKIFIVPCGMKTTKVVVKGLRPLESDLQPTFCWFTWADEYEHVWDRSMLVLYPAPVVVSSVISLCFIYKMITSVKIDKCFQGIHSCLSLQILNPPCLWIPSITPCLQIFSSRTPHPYPCNSEKLSVVLCGYFLELPNHKTPSFTKLKFSSLSSNSCRYWYFGHFKTWQSNNLDFLILILLSVGSIQNNTPSALHFMHWSIIWVRKHFRGWMFF